MRKIFPRFFAIVFIAVSILLFANVARACSCVERGTMDMAEKAPNIVILKLRDVIKNNEGEKGYGYGGIKYSQLVVEKVYKGNLKVEQILDFSQGGGGDCIWTFDKKNIGAEYLFYLDKKPYKDGQWFGFWCSRSAPLKAAGDDVLYLEKMDKVRGKTRLSGTVTKQIKPSIEGEELSTNFLSEHIVRITGNGKNLELKTDKNGVYEIYDLPPGIYTVAPQKIEGFKVYQRGKSIDSERVLIRPKGHAQLNLNFKIFNSISGKLLDDKGGAMKSVCLDLEHAVGKKPSSFIYLACTKEDGSFKFTEIPVGTYFIVINQDGEVTANEPFGAFYYPNTINKEQAKPVTIKAGEHIEGLVINAIPSVETITIKGKVIFEDGISPTKARDQYALINFVPDNPNYDEKNRRGKSYDHTNSTNENGEFSLRVYKGQKGKLFATMHSYVGLYENCPKLDALVKAKGNSVEDVETNILEIDAEKDLDTVILKFPFPSCKKAKID